MTDDLAMDLVQRIIDVAHAERVKGHRTERVYVSDSPEVLRCLTVGQAFGVQP